MNAKQRALNIWESYYKNIPNMSVKDATQCAIIHVRGIIEALSRVQYGGVKAKWELMHYEEVLHHLNKKP